MKARTRNQRRVVELSEKLHDISRARIEWAKENCFDHPAVVHPKSGNINCFMCGHTWKSEFVGVWKELILDDHKCPNCKRKLKLEVTRKRTEEYRGYFTIITKCKEYQLTRTFRIEVKFKTSQSPQYSIWEIQQIFTKKDGKQEVVGVAGSGFSSYQESWNGTMELRHPSRVNNKYGAEGVIYPKKRIHDWIYKKGFTWKLYKQTGYIFNLVVKRLYEPIMETIAKRKAYTLFTYGMDQYHFEKIQKYWPTIRICFRNNYPISDTYFDMLNALEYLNKDLHNPFYVCPQNFMEAHDYWIDVKRKRQAKIRAEENRKERIERMLKMREDRLKYAWRMRKYKNFSIKQDGDEFNYSILIKPLLELEEVAEAGDAMRHCIFQTKSYWKSPNNLLLGTYENGELIETTQVVLNDYKVVHSYGPFNKPSKHHVLILQLIEHNMDKIKKINKTRKKRKQKKKQLA